MGSRKRLHPLRGIRLRPRARALRTGTVPARGVLALDPELAFDDRRRAARRGLSRQHAPRRDGEGEGENQDDGDPPRNEQRDEAERDQAGRQEHARNGSEDPGDLNHGKRREAGPMPRSISPADSQPLNRLRYSPVGLSISILSPVAQKSGTWMTKPDLSFAALVTLPEVSPFTAGSV